MIERPLLAGSLRDSPRNDFEREVVLRFRDLRRPVSAILKDISATGMFIRSRDSRPAGANLSFELSLSDEDQPVRGEGEVVWMRRFELGVAHPAGMGIRFLDLEQGSRRVLRSFIAELYGPSGPPLDAGGDGSTLGAAGDPTTDPEPVAYARPLSGLTSSQASRLYSYAGCAAARPDRGWSRRVRRALSQLAQAAGNALRLRG